ACQLGSRLPGKNGGIPLDALSQLGYHEGVALRVGLEARQVGRRVLKTPPAPAKTWQEGSAMQTVTRKPRTIHPAHGNARWLKAPGADGDGGRLEISAQTMRGVITAVYAVTALRSGKPGGHFGGQLVGYQLANEHNGEVYSLDFAGLT